MPSIIAVAATSSIEQSTCLPADWASATSAEPVNTSNVPIIRTDFVMKLIPISFPTTQRPRRLASATDMCKDQLISGIGTTQKRWSAASGREHSGSPMRPHLGRRDRQGDRGPAPRGLRAGPPSFSPDGSRIVTASGDKTAHIWDARIQTMR